MDSAIPAMAATPALGAEIPDVPPKAARKQAMATLGIMMGTRVMARIAGNGEFSEEIPAAGRDTALGRLARARPGPGKLPAKKAAAVVRH